MVPNGWKETKLIDTSAKEKYSFTGGPFGSDLKSSDYTDNGVRIIQLQNIGDGKFNNGYKIFTSEEKADELSSCNIFPNEIILSKMGDPVARATIIPSHHKRYLMASDGIRLKVDESKYDTFFIHEVINAPHFRGIALSKSTGSTRKRIGLTDLKNITFHCPPLIEQQKIAKILSTWDKAISTTERLIDNSTQQKKALMQKLLTGKKRLLDDSGKRFEGEWKSKVFKNILKLDRGSSPRPIIQYMTDSEDGVNWIKIGDTKGEGLYINSTKEKITKEGAEKSRKVSKGEVVLSNSMSYGKPYILNIDGYIHDGWFVIRKFEKNIDVNFLIQILSSELIQKQYKRLAAGGVVSNISSELVYAVKVDLPSIPEQQKIATVLTSADKEIELLEQQLADLQQEKKALMQVLLTGKVRVVVDG
ncbi:MULTISPECIES: restriction endonuclease subunit S [unclassified Psychrobacter]|uniref:restriction endonuclease subunit S n=1 Tax=unclassified Psychrobacter TaxID=196806 RepID=UPI0025FE663A|nr:MULTISPECIES: restriction endonuclease subunit S [unclassified Psychrobacter]